MEASDQLKDLRQQIDTVTYQLVLLINKRAEVALRIGKAKQDRPIYDPKREAAVLAQVAAHNPGPLSDEALQTIFTEIITACRDIQASHADRT